MKRFLCGIAMVLFLCACSQMPKQTEDAPFLRGLWITSYEFAPEHFTDSESQYREKIAAICNQAAKKHITDLFVQVRPNSDSFYFSDIFPTSERLSGQQGKDAAYDALQLMLQQAKEYSLAVHAWINPYRICTGQTDIRSLCDGHPAKKLYKADKSTVFQTQEGLYWNPANEKVQKLIIDGVREILRHYDVDGIHIDDYFYPTQDTEIDNNSYRAYQKQGGTLSLEEYRRTCVSRLVSGLYQAVKSENKNALFTISPCGDIQRNYDTLYADVALWAKQDGYADYIMPQLYYGFKNENKPFESTLNDWLLLADSQKFIIGLAAYKKGQEDAYAGKGKNEWIKEDGILDRQEKQCQKSGVKGICFFSYSYIF